MKYSSLDQVELFGNMLHRSLSILVGKVYGSSRHIATVGTRFRLLTCGLSLVQGEALPRDLSKSVLRERIYSAAVDYFWLVFFSLFYRRCLTFVLPFASSPQICPLQKGNELREDIMSLIKFWQTLHSERKYFKTAVIPDNVSDTVSQSGYLISSINQQTWTGSTEFRSTPTGWINTVPLSSNLSTTSKRSSGHRSTVNNKKNNSLSPHLFKDFSKKRTLILGLVAVEIEFLLTWYNPLSLTECQFANEDTITAWKSQTFINERSWKENARLAWEISPTLAVYLPCRFKNSEALKNEVSRLVRLNPLSVSHIPGALKYLITPDTILNETPEVSGVHNNYL